MRTLMMAASIAMVMTGTFCIANASVAFASTAFVVGVIMCFVGIVELLVSRNTSINEDRGDMNFPVSGMILVLVGVSVLSGVVAEDVTVAVLFAFIVARDGFIDIFGLGTNFAEQDIDEKITFAVGSLSVLVAVYMLYNSMLLNLPTQMLVGFVIILMGIRRFRAAMQINYTHPGFLTGNEEKLADAQREEKRAMAKAKEGIRESKEAQRRIEKIKHDIAVERKNMDDTAIRKKLQ
ncbi:MAG: DUF308 domain-containing protein [Firmicutes bacterium]|nr:DUF308 domain-containing protein [Bacillota bacterium]